MKHCGTAPAIFHFLPTAFSGCLDAKEKISASHLHSASLIPSGRLRVFRAMWKPASVIFHLARDHSAKASVMHWELHLVINTRENSEFGILRQSSGQVRNLK